MKNLHTVWRRMNDRCYNENHSTYKNYGALGATVCDEWRSYKGFKVWAEANYVEGYELDKDLLVKGNKQYSPEFCRFIPAGLNKLLTTRESLRGELPLGVCLQSDGIKYRAQITRNGKRIHLGTRASPQAAHQLWQQAKIEAIMEASLLDGTPSDISKSLVARAEDIMYDLLHDKETKSL